MINGAFFEKNTIGKQLVTSTDSIAANIAEGYGRFFIKKAVLLLVDSYQEIIASMEKIRKKLTSYIRSIGKATDQ